jgi:hypothetical protein
MPRKKFRIDPVMGRVISVGFFHSPISSKKDVFRLEVDMHDMEPKERRKLINYLMKTCEKTRAEKKDGIPESDRRR